MQAERHEPAAAAAAAAAAALDYISKAWGSRKVSESDTGSIQQHNSEGRSWAGLPSRRIAEEALSLRMCLRNLTMLRVDRRADSWKWQHVHFICEGRGTFVAEWMCINDTEEELFYSKVCLFPAGLLHKTNYTSIRPCFYTCTARIAMFAEFCWSGEVLVALKKKKTMNSSNLIDYTQQRDTYSKPCTFLPHNL